MFRTFHHLCLLLIVGSFLAAPAAKAGVFKGHPYHDPHASVHSGAGIVASDSGVYVVPYATNCDPAPAGGISTGEAYFEPQSSAQLYGALSMSAASGRCRNCPPATNALLRVWVNENATILVNGTATKPQRLAGANRGSRIFSLTGLEPSIISQAVVRAQITFTGDNQPTILEKTIPVRAGTQFEVRITDAELTAARPRVRVSADLLALYDFKLAGADNIIRDVSGVGTPLDLFIHDTSKVVWLDDGLRVVDSVLIQSGMTAEKIQHAAQYTNEITIEAWITPAATARALPSPAPIVSLSSDPMNRNVTLGQQEDYFDVRLRTTNTDVNGLPSTSSLKGTVRTEPTHVVFTRDSAGTSTIFLDGRPFSRYQIGGQMSTWAPFHLLLANELTGDRPWLGTFHLVAIYGRALSEDEVRHNYQSGHD